MICEGKVVKSEFKDYLKTVRESWVMNVSNTPENAKIEIFYKGNKGYTLEATYKISKSGVLKTVVDTAVNTVESAVTLGKKKPDKLLEALSDQNLVRQLSLILHDQLPMFSVVRFKKDGKHIFNLPAKIIVPKALDMWVYELSYNSSLGIWESKVVGSIKDDGGRWLYDLQKGAVDFNKPYYVQAKVGRGGHVGRITPFLDKELGKYGFNSLLDDLFSSLDSSFAGLRIGIPMLKGDNLISQSTLISTFVESRSGLLKGLRFYYDIAPELTDGEEKFGWKRASLGWSLDLPMPGFLAKHVDRVDAAFKLGLTDISANFAVLDTSSNSYIYLPFEASNSLSLGVEFGVEKTLIGILMRAWFSYDNSGLLGGDVSFSTIKLGLDSYFDVYDFIGNGTTLQALAFTFYEQPTLSKSGEDEDVLIKEVSYRLFFIGGGLTISW